MIPHFVRSLFVLGVRMRMAFWEKLRMLIEERGLTQKQLALELRIPASTLGGYVQGTSTPDYDTLVEIADFFEVSVDFLLSHPTADTQDETEEDLLRVYRLLSPENRSIYLEQGKAFIRLKAYYDPLSSK